MDSAGHGSGGEADGRTTFNVGRIEGGSAINIVPNACEVVWEFRPAPDEDIAALTGTIEAYVARTMPAGVEYAAEILTRVPPLPPDPAGKAMRTVEGFGGRHPTLAMPFGTEAGFFREAGISSVVCGPGSIAQAHQPDEWIAVDQIAAAECFMDRVGTWAVRDGD